MWENTNQKKLRIWTLFSRSASHFLSKCAYLIIEKEWSFEARYHKIMFQYVSRNNENQNR